MDIDSPTIRRLHKITLELEGTAFHRSLVLPNLNLVSGRYSTGSSTTLSNSFK